MRFYECEHCGAPCADDRNLDGLCGNCWHDLHCDWCGEWLDDAGKCSLECEQNKAEYALTHKQ